MIDDNDEEDEEQNIELRRGGGRSASPQHSGNNRYTSSAGSSSFSPPRRSSSPTAAARTNGSRRSVAEGQQDQQHHAIHLGQHDVRPPSYSNPTAPLLEKFTSVLSATSQVVNLDTVADSVAEAMSLLQHPFGGGSTGRRKNLETYSLEPKLQEAKETHTRLKLQAFWQLLLTGFEVLKFAIGKRARKRIFWLGLDGRLYLTHTKSEKKANKSIFLADVYRVQKGSEAQSFTKSQSWRDARSKEPLCFSIHGKHGKEEKTFALQVMVASVRNVLADNFDALLQKMKSDADGEFPFVAQKVIAQQYAISGEVLTLHQVEDILLREEDEKKILGKEFASGKRSASVFEGNMDNEHDGESSDDSDLSDVDDQRDILG